MITILIVFAISLIQNYIATRVIVSIAIRDASMSSLWAGLSSAGSYAVVILIVDTSNRWELLLPYVLGDMLATYIAVKGR